MTENVFTFSIAPKNQINNVQTITEYWIILFKKQAGSRTTNTSIEDIEVSTKVCSSLKCHYGQIFDSHFFKFSYTIGLF